MAEAERTARGASLLHWGAVRSQPAPGGFAVILLTNDDGFDAPGLDALQRAVPPGSGPIVRAAPMGAWSNGSHALTTHVPIRVEGRGERAYAVGGSPADCVRVALAALEIRPSWILSGINPGGNLGTDAWPSGTIAAAREATLHGHRAIAISHYIASGRTIDWDEAACWTRAVLERLLSAPPPAGAFWNVNLPHPEPGGLMPETVFCPVDPSPLPLEFALTEGGFVYTARYQSRDRRPGHDVEVCLGGRISVSLISALPTDVVRPQAVGWP
jgi:5'-nucleotidase